MGKDQGRYPVRVGEGQELSLKPHHYETGMELSGKTLQANAGLLAGIRQAAVADLSKGGTKCLPV